MNKRYMKAIRTSTYRKEELSIEECINRYAEENDVTIVQFQIHSCTDASVLYEENFKRAYIKKVTEYFGGDPMNHITVERCSNCGSKALSKDRCLHCNAKLFPKPSI